MRKYSLEIVVFVSGAIVMIFELVGSRLLAPYLGTSLVVWTGVIGIVLGSLSVGYWLGGRLSDADPRPERLSFVLFLSGLLLALLGFIHTPLLITIQQHIFQIHTGVLVSCLLLFTGPSLFLGMVLPYAVRLRMTTVQSSGATVGNLYAWSTLGSIAGTFLAGFFLIAYLGHDRILFLTAALLMLLSFFVSLNRTKNTIFMGALFFLCALASPVLAKMTQGPGLLDVNTDYNRVWIYENQYAGGPTRMMQVNEENDSAMYLDRDDLVFHYTRFFKLGAHFVPEMQSALMIGGAAYSFPRYFLAAHPEASMHVVEIDPKLTDLARQHFKLAPDPRLRITHEDARTYLNRATEKVDMIYCDAFKSYSIPFQLTTREAITHMYDLLNDNGAVLVNIASAVEGDAGQFLRAQVATLKTKFPLIYVFLVQNAEDTKMVQNILIVALKSSNPPKFYSTDPELSGYLQHVYVGDIGPGEVLTDNYAPVDRYVMPMVQELSEGRYNPIVDHWKKRVKRS